MSDAQPPSRRLRVMPCITRLGLGGAERVALSLWRELRAEVDFAFFAVHGAAPDAVGAAMRAEFEAAATPWFAGTAVPMKAGGMVPGGLALARAVRAFRPDVIHFHSETPEACGAVAAYFWPAHVRGRTVRTIHNSIYWRYWPRIGRWCDRQLAPALITCVSEAARQEFLRYRHDSGVGSPPADPVVIYNGVAPPVDRPSPRSRAPGLRRVLFAGRFEYQKGTDVLCRALPLVSLGDGVRGELVLHGQGAHEPLVRALAADAPAGWTVTLHPPVADLGVILPQFDVVVMPSRFEGLGLVAIEATLGGLPVVATDAPGLREALPPGYPWRAAPGDAVSLARTLTAALNEPARWAETVQQAQQFTRDRFNLATMSGAYHSLYQRMAGRGPR